MRKLDTLHIYCIHGIRTKLTVLADANHRSLSSEVQVLIEEAYAAHIAKEKAKQNMKD